MTPPSPGIRKKPTYVGTLWLKKPLPSSTLLTICILSIPRGQGMFKHNQLKSHSLISFLYPAKPNWEHVKLPAWQLEQSPELQQILSSRNYNSLSPFPEKVIHKSHKPASCFSITSVAFSQFHVFSKELNFPAPCQGAVQSTESMASLC